MTYILFLDDIRMPDDVTWVTGDQDGLIQVARDYDQFVEIVKENGIPKFVWFDHDLADEHYQSMLAEHQGKSDVDYGTEKTGYDCAKWLTTFCEDVGMKFAEYVVHSMNPAGKERIVGYIENAKKHLGI